MNKSRAVLVAVLVGLLLGGGGLLVVGGTFGTGLRREQVLAEGVFRGRGGVYNYVNTDFLSFAHVQTYTFDPSVVTVVERELVDPRGPAFERREYGYSTSYEVRGVSSFRRDVFYLVGVALGGETVIERWQKPKTFATALPGSPAPQPMMERTELYRGADFPDPVALGADPQARYLLLVYGAPRVLAQLTLPDVVRHSVVYTVQQVPHLASIADLTGLDHPTLGRTWSGYGPDAGGAYCTFFVDSENDGSIDAFRSMTFPEFDAQYNQFELEEALFYYGD